MGTNKLPVSSAVREIRLQAITKKFGPIPALAGVDFDLKAGEVHAVLGENGAGKSTLMKILFGLYRPDAGAIYLDGRPVKISSAAIAMQLGFAFVQQHFSLVDTLTVAENVVLGVLSKRFYHPQRLQEQIQSFIDAQGLMLNASALLADLGVGEKQRVEIIKALYRNAAFIIFDEPTSVLAPQEVAVFFATMRQLQAAGKGIIFITHKLDEALEMSDRITILRAGKKVATINPGEATAESLVRMMMGEIASTKKVSVTQRNKTEKQIAVLEVVNIKVGNDQSRLAVNGVSFELHAGEILSVAGVDGSGQRELAEAIMGLRKAQSGIIKWETFLPKEQNSKLLEGSARRRLGFIPSDRMAEAFVAEFSVAENLLLERSDDPRFRQAGLLSPVKIDAEAKWILESFNVLSKGPEQKLRELSGGNQQKFLLGRSLSTNPEVLVAMNPTWGVDVAATAAIHQRLLQMRHRGGAILLFSIDLDEIYALSDRFFVLHAGRMMGWATADTSITQVGLWMAGRE